MKLFNGTSKFNLNWWQLRFCFVFGRQLGIVSPKPIANWLSDLLSKLNLSAKRTPLVNVGIKVDDYEISMQMSLNIIKRQPLYWSYAFSAISRVIQRQAPQANDCTTRHLNLDSNKGVRLREVFPSFIC